MLAGVLAAQQLAEATDDAVWGEIAQLHAADAQLDAGSVVADPRRRTPRPARPGRWRSPSMSRKAPCCGSVRNFQNSIAIDTVRNEYTFHRQIHDWLAAMPAADLNVNELNERVYAELFLTPGNDPWLGLLPANTYTAIENNGVQLETSAGAGGR